MSRRAASLSRSSCVQRIFLAHTKNDLAYLATGKPGRVSSFLSAWFGIGVQINQGLRNLSEHSEHFSGHVPKDWTVDLETFK